MFKTQSKIKAIHKEVAQEAGITLTQVENIMESVWETLRLTIEDDPRNAIYLRHLGTFYGKESMIVRLAEFRKLKKNDTR